MLGLIALWFRQVREAELASGESVDTVSLPDKSKLFEALQRLPISFGMAMRVSVARSGVDVVPPRYLSPISRSLSLRLHHWGGWCTICGLWCLDG